jgi:hypothetical protein
MKQIVAALGQALIEDARCHLMHCSSTEGGVSWLHPQAAAEGAVGRTVACFVV